MTGAGGGGGRRALGLTLGLILLQVALLGGALGCGPSATAGGPASARAAAWTASEAQGFVFDLQRAVASRSSVRETADTAVTAMARACFASPSCAGDCGLTLFDLGYQIWPRPKHACAALGGDPRDVPRLSRHLGERIQREATAIEPLLPAGDRQRLRCALDRLGLAPGGANPDLCSHADARTLADVLADFPSWHSLLVFSQGESRALEADGGDALLTATCARLPECAGRCGRALLAPLQQSSAQIEALLGGPAGGVCPEARQAALAPAPGDARTRLVTWGAQRARSFARAARGRLAVTEAARLDCAMARFAPAGTRSRPASCAGSQPVPEHRSAGPGPARFVVVPPGPWPSLEVSTEQAVELTRSLRSESDRRVSGTGIDGGELRQFASYCAVDAGCAAGCGLGLYYYYYFPGEWTRPLPSVCGALGGDPRDRARIEAGVTRRLQQWWGHARPLVSASWRRHVDCALGRLRLAPPDDEACAWADAERLSDLAIRSLAGAGYKRGPALRGMASDCANTPGCVGSCKAVFDALAAGDSGEPLRKRAGQEAARCPGAAQAVTLRSPGKVQATLMEWAGSRAVEHLQASQHRLEDGGERLRCALGYAGLAKADLRACPDRRRLASIH